MTRIHYLHIGKTGGTAIKSALGPYLKSGANEIVLHSHATTLADIPIGEPVFFTVRDPADRFVSAFNGMLRQGHPRYNDVWTPEEAEMFQKFRRPADLALALSHPDESTRALAFRAMDTIQHVSTGLQTWLGNRTYLEYRARDILWIGETSDLDRHFLKLHDLLALPDACVLPKDPYEANIRPATDDVHMDDAGLRNLQLWFRVDYTILAYCRSKIVQQSSASRRQETTAADDQDADRSYTLAPPFALSKGLAWIAALPSPLHLGPSTMERGRAIFEDGRKLLPTSSMHADISSLGNGANAFWKDVVCFSTSDGSDPNFNNRTYTVALERPRFG